MRWHQQYYWIVSIALFAGAWEALHLLLQSFILPSPLEVAGVMLNLVLSGEIFPHAFASLKRTLVGFFLGLLAGSAFGVCLGLNVFLQKTIGPIIELLRSIPPIAWIPLAILWFGIGDNAAFFIIFIASFYPVFTEVFFGLRSLPLIYKQVKENYRLNLWQYLRHIIAPFTAPFLLSGAKTAIGFSWMCVIAAEMVSANQGLGYFIEINRVLLRPEFVIATMLAIGIIGYCLHLIVLRIEKKATAWRSTAYV